MLLMMPREQRYEERECGVESKVEIGEEEERLSR